MGCKIYNRLLGHYQRSVRSYTIAARSVAKLKVAGAPGDFAVAFKEAERLRANCQDTSNEVLHHLNRNHQLTISLPNHLANGVNQFRVTPKSPKAGGSSAD